jgi:hypothetical protein
MKAQPWHEPVETELIGFVEPSNKLPDLLGVCRETQVIDGEKSIGSGKSRAFVAIDEGVILRQTLPEI